jgi:alanine racemase
MLAVLKADAYGHGAARIAQTALLHGATMVGTACLSEAVALRERGIMAPMLILGYTPPWQARDAVRYDVSATVYSLDVVQQLSRAARLQGSRAARIHIKVDTGMGRLGLQPEEVRPFVEQVSGLPGVEVEGVFTHLATADARDQSYAKQQLGRFREVLDELARHGVRPRYVHAANSGATLSLPESHHNLVRVGIAMYGHSPSPAVRVPSDFRAALAFKTQIAQIKRVPAGSCISYGCTYHTQRPSTIAVIPAGYGDGFRRSPNNGGTVLVRGRRAPIVGVVCMDMCMLDVTDIPGVRQGDEVVLIGAQDGDRITVEELAASFGTINYEVISQILARVPREVF